MATRDVTVTVSCNVDEVADPAMLTATIQQAVVTALQLTTGITAVVVTGVV